MNIPKFAEHLKAFRTKTQVYEVMAMKTYIMDLSYHTPKHHKASWNNLIIKSRIATRECMMGTMLPELHSTGAQISELGAEFLSVIKMLANFI